MFYLMLAALDEEERSLVERLYYEYRSRMFAIAYSILQNPHDAEDAVENTAIKIIKYIREFIDIPCNKTEALIVLYTKSSAIDIYRKRTKSPMLTIDNEDAPDVADDSESLEDFVLSIDFVDKLKTHIESLRPQFREVFIYKYYYEKSNREIAELLQINENTVRSRLKRARDMLREKMVEKDD